MKNKLVILYLEDNKVDVETARNALMDENISCKIIQVADEMKFIRVLDRYPVDIILADYLLKKYEGISALEFSKNYYPEIPFIFVSAQMNEKIVVDAIKAGATDFIIKQRPHSLIPAINRALNEAEERKKRKMAENALSHLMFGMSSETGNTFFSALVEHLAKWLSVKYVLISEILPEKPEHAYGLAYWENGILASPPDYDLSDTPCEEVIEKGFCLHKRNASKLFPKLKMFSSKSKKTARKIEFYSGIRIHDEKGDTLGILCAFNDRQLNDDQQINNVFQIFASRAASEIKRLRYEKEKTKLENQLRQAQKLEALGTLAGGIAHDFNNILFPIVCYTEMALNDVQPNSELHEFLENIQESASRAKDLIQQILTFSRQKESELKPLKIQFVLEEAAKLLRATLPATIRIHADIRRECGLIMADPTQIHQMLMNLGTNAFHAMQDTGGLLEISLKEVILTHEDIKDMDIGPGSYIRLSVRDSGQGIDSGIIDRIFDPYFSTKETGKGTGLGLAIVRGIVKDCGGEIKVSSTPGKGTEFNIYIPELAEHIDEKIICNNDFEIPKGAERILLVDDEDSIIRSESRILTNLGYHVVAKSASPDILALFRKNPYDFDLVITDQTMPDMTGIQLIEKLRETRPDIPVVICTGFSEQVDKEKAMALGIDEFLMKPITKAQLANTVRKVLDQYH